MGKWCPHAISFIFDRIIIKVAGNQDRHKSSDEFDFGPLICVAHLYGFCYFRVTCLDCWKDHIWPWHIGLRWPIVALWATCYLWVTSWEKNLHSELCEQIRTIIHVIASLFYEDTCSTFSITTNLTYGSRLNITIIYIYIHFTLCTLRSIKYMQKVWRTNVMSD